VVFRTDSATQATVKNGVFGRLWNWLRQRRF